MIANHGAPVLGASYRIYYVNENLGFLIEKYGSIEQAIEMLTTDPEAAALAWFHAGLRYLYPDMPEEEARAILKRCGPDAAAKAIKMAADAFHYANAIPKTNTKINN